jgi:hypothetical protein
MDIIPRLMRQPCQALITLRLYGYVLELVRSGQTAWQNLASSVSNLLSAVVRGTAFEYGLSSDQTRSYSDEA